MTPERWSRVGELFHAALEQPDTERKHWVESACAGDAELRAEVLSLLGSDAVAGQGFIENRIQPAVASLLHADGQPVISARVGPYRLVRELGRGGMGTVYLAERDDEEYQAQVAIKLVRRGMDTDLILSRFYRERQTLALLQHPNIARLLDGGTTAEGYPYIVMEFVEGERITNYSHDRNLSVARKLTLFLSVCKAVSYAHRQFVVHRDLKPGNILVDKAGDVKLLDFGICKLLQTPSTERDATVDVGLVALTPDYASPEQIRGDPINVASDIYSLAAVLYELLTGVKPHKIEEYSLRGIERAICETEIVRPSLACANKAVARQLKGDLDNILAVALDKEPQRRYESVDQFAEDIRRYLAHEPVKARPDSLQYRLGKFLRRRQGFVAAAVAVLITLSAGIFVSARSARMARENLRLVRQLSNTFLFDVHDAVRNLPGATAARQLIVKTGLQYLENLSRGAAGDADFQYEVAAAYRRVGDVQGDVMNANLGNMKEALASYDKALTLLEAALTMDPYHRLAMSEQITVYRRMGNIQEYRREQKQALSSFQKAEGIAQAWLTRTPDDARFSLQLAEVHIASSNALRRGADWAAARKGYSKAAEMLEKLDKAYPGDWETRMSLASAYSGGAMCDAQVGRSREALEAHRKAAAIRENLLKKDEKNVVTRRDLMLVYSHIGDVLGSPNLPNLGDTKGAVQAYARMLEIARQIHDADPADQRARSDYANALTRMAVVEEIPSRIRMLRQAIQLQNEVAQTNPDDRSNRSDLTINYKFLGDAYLSTNDPQNAMRAYREGVRLAESMFPAVTPTQSTGTVMMYRKLGEMMARNGERRAALEMGEKALQLVDPAGPAAKNWPVSPQKLMSARGAAAMGSIFAALAKSADRRPSDQKEARRWLQNGLQLYRAREALSPLTYTLRREMQDVESELEKLK